jgi:hypothetical protein
MYSTQIKIILKIKVQNVACTFGWLNIRCLCELLCQKDINLFKCKLCDYSCSDDPLSKIYKQYTWTTPSV